MPFLTITILVALVLLIPTAYAGWIGAPYAPTRLAVVRKAFRELGISKSDTVVDLGAGDGSILLTAAERGSYAIGFELSPIMWAIAALRSLGKPTVTVKWKNFYQEKFPEATVIFAFLMPDNMERVRQIIKNQPLPKLNYVLAYAFPFKDVPPLKVIHEKKCAPLYVYSPEDL